MIYVDTSCLMQVLVREEFTAKVEVAIHAEPVVIISPLTELEMMVQFKAMWMGGQLTRAQSARLEAEFLDFRNTPPFEFRNLAGAIFQRALRQHRNSQEVLCRAVDRLHLAAMEELGVGRLMTLDRAQARAAEQAGFSVLRPGRE